MTRYSYTAISADGSLVNGEISAENEAMALDLVARQGFTPIGLRTGRSLEAWWRRDISFSVQSGALAPPALERFFFTLSAMLRAGFSLPRAIAFCEKQTRDRKAKRALGTIKADLENGASLGSAMRSAGAAFPERFISLVSIGEAANRLDALAAQTAALLASEARLRRDLRAALIYPAILLCMSSLVVGVIIFYLAPTLLPVFSAAGANPPRLLNFLAAAGHALAVIWPALIVLAALLGAVAFGLRRTLAPPIVALLFRLPLIGPFLRKRETLRLCQSLQLMLQSGASLPRALAAAKDAVTTAPFRALLDEAEKQVLAGQPLAGPLKAGALVDDTALTLIEAGEESDRLVDVLETAVETLAAETGALLSQVVSLLTPLLTLVIGLTVGGLILTTISAIMDLNDIAF